MESTLRSHSFQMEHSPRGAEASFSMGWLGHGGGFSLEGGLVGKQDIFLGYQRDDVIHCLPYCQASQHQLATGMAEFIPTNDSEESGPQGVKISYLPEQLIQRDFQWATDNWSTPEIQFTLCTPVSGIPDPETAPAAQVKDAVAPVILGKLTFDNRAGASPMRGFFAIGGLEQIRFLEDETGGELSGVATLDGYGFAVRTQDVPGVQAFGDFNLEHLFWRPAPVKFRLASTAGILLDIPAGETLTIDIAFAWYREGIVTTGRQCSYLYTRYFSDLTEVMRYGLGRVEAWHAEASKMNRLLSHSGLTEDQQFLIAKATRSYYGSTQLFKEGNKPRWVVNEGSCNMINTLDLTVDMAFFELRYHPWALRNVLDSFADEYAYCDTIHFPDEPEKAYPGGIAFTHDQGMRNAFSPQGYSAYEITDHPGCFSYMTHEELLNWVLCAGLYVHATGDTVWLHKRVGLLLDCLSSMQHRDHPSATCRDGVMDLDSNRCGRESEITTYDSLDASLGQSRRNTYLAVKCWAGYLALAQMLTTADAHRWHDEIAAAQQAAQLAADTITSAFDENLGYIPAILDGGDTSAIIPIIEGLIYPDQLGLYEELSEDGEYGALITTLRRHLMAVLQPGRCLFADGGWKLSGNNDNSWMSKIFICQYVARAVMGIDFGAETARFDRAHAHWWRVGCASHSVVDQVVAGKVPGEGSIYPRCVTNILWLDEVQNPPHLVQIAATESDYEVEL